MVASFPLARSRHQAGGRGKPLRGAPLELRCPVCSATNLPGERFCGECGTPLTGDAVPPAFGLGGPGGAPTAAPVSERRLVTVLFADLVGCQRLGRTRTLQAPVASRIDNLSAAERSLLQDAAVIGQAGAGAGVASSGGGMSARVAWLKRIDARSSVTA